MHIFSLLKQRIDDHYSKTGMLPKILEVSLEEFELYEKELIPWVTYVGALHNREIEPANFGGIPLRIKL